MCMSLKKWYKHFILFYIMVFKILHIYLQKKILEETFADKCQNYYSFLFIMWLYIVLYSEIFLFIIKACSLHFWLNMTAI